MTTRPGDDIPEPAALVVPTHTGADTGLAELVHQERPSPNFDERTAPIDTLVIHYTEMDGPDLALTRMCDPEAGVSAHYLISEAGEVFRLVQEDKRAWHAGVSCWRGNTDVNNTSIGIELDHPGHRHGYREFSETQFLALVPLVARIVKEHGIPRANVVGHSDVAPQRKIDPGELFPWDRLAEYGLCLPRPAKLELGDPFDNDGAFYLALERFGYDIADGRKAVEAFQRRWRPERIDGEIDGQVRAILFQLLLDRDEGRTR
ncbi:N-acetylmuramoyl-L-alanine amidase [Alteripontixanthobacter maritimus]|uniref:N-acetylmuramoyl-L-alanine amidase n=1 Tax=Alteripontixanthobacter maritimus TaxID=2161824 RepID=A0A369Q7U4_9SPHN|nr:N-acetylmuramoyl-L-alanine amidase [Alteripontixanthobacter maritimus]RDC59246.1 N-acetylmuramoyl-L-alanine amidase [Alteripontixanthobacter maritimus]